MEWLDRFTKIPSAFAEGIFVNRKGNLTFVTTNAAFLQPTLFSLIQAGNFSLDNPFEHKTSVFIPSQNSEDLIVDRQNSCSIFDLWSKML